MIDSNPPRVYTVRAIVVGSLIIALAQMNISITKAQEINNGELARVFKAAIATIMGREVRTIRLDATKDSIAYVSYIRPTDGKLWKNRCRVEGDQVIWGTVDASGPGSGFGPWRNRPEDERILYRTAGKMITITEISSDGSKSNKALAVD